MLAISRKPVILCVDESASQLWLRAQVLEQNGYSVLQATTAVRALQMLTESPVSLTKNERLAAQALSGQFGALPEVMRAYGQFLTFQHSMKRQIGPKRFNPLRLLLAKLL